MIIFIIITISIATAILFTAEYSTHIEMSKKYKPLFEDKFSHYEFTTFKRFLEEFNQCYSYHDFHDFGFKNSLFLKDPNNRFNEIINFHASVVFMNNRCMIFYPLGYIKYNLWIRQFKKENSYRINYRWN